MSRALGRSRRLFARHQHWAERRAAHFVRARKVPAFLVESVANAALIGLWDAAVAYRRGLAGVKFRTFARWRVLGSMRDDLREHLEAIAGIAVVAPVEHITSETGLTWMEFCELYNEMVSEGRCA
jgi:hypothetical protein